MISKTHIRKIFRGIICGLLYCFGLISLMNSIYFETNKSNHLIRSSSLKKTEFNDNNGNSIIEYHDENGNLYFAADKGYAAYVITKQGNQITESYLNENREPVKQLGGYYSIIRELDDRGNEIRISYLDINGTPVVTSSGYAISERTFDLQNRILTERYYDDRYNPIRTYSMGYGRLNLYDNEENNIEVQYLNEQGIVEETPAGFAILKRSYDYRGRVAEEFYCDKNGHSVSLTLGQNGLHKEYDEFGRVCLLLYLNADGDPAPVIDGYTVVKYTYYPDDTVRTEMYFDEEGNPVALSQGQYGVLKVAGNSIFLDATGRERYNLGNYLQTHPTGVVLLGVVIILVSSMCERKINILIMLGYLVFIFYMTLMYRPFGEPKAEMEILWSFRQLFSEHRLRMQIQNNIWLFIPLGSILYNLKPRLPILVFPIMLSLIVEITQYFTGLGLCEIDDIISNGIGSIIGLGLAYVVKCYTVNRHNKSLPMRHST